MLRTDFRRCIALLCCAGFAAGVASSAFADSPVTPGVLTKKGAIDVIWEINAGAPQNIVAYALDTTALGKKFSLPAFKVSTAAGSSDSAASCGFDAGIGTGDCVSCPTDADYYLDANAMAKLPGIKVVNATTAAGLVTIDGLTAGDKYSVFIQYAGRDQFPSECMPAYPY